jgi:hypothetical protein
MLDQNAIIETTKTIAKYILVAAASFQLVVYMVQLSAELKPKALTMRSTRYTTLISRELKPLLQILHKKPYRQAINLQMHLVPAYCCIIGKISCSFFFNIVNSFLQHYIMAGFTRVYIVL